jgi:hypothetical protein
VIPFKICNFRFTLSAAIFAMSCGPLPTAKNFYGSLDKWPLSIGSTGLALNSTDTSYSSTDIYFYNFGTGELYPLATGDSGDVSTKWDGRKLWIFNRATGKTSYSNLSPKGGSATRNVERRTPDADGYDPADWIDLVAGESALALGTSHKVTIANLSTATTVSSNLGEVSTGQPTVPFRPGILLKNYGNVSAGTKTSSNENFAVIHQALTTTWTALGGGKIYLAKRGDNGAWEWADQDVLTAGIQGVSLSVSNPIAAVDCEENSSSDAACLVLGACYTNMGASCVGGVDLVDWSFYKSTRHLYDWPTSTTVAGDVKKGAKTGQLIACLKSTTDANAQLTVLDSATGAILATWDAGASICGPFAVDRDGARVFAIKNNKDSSTLHALSPELNQISQVALSFTVVGLEAINE